MNSLVVYLSLVALAVAKPSGLALDAGVIAYSSPLIATAPAAVSYQSRLDIKSSPAVVATTAIEPIARTVVAAPAVLAAPAITTAAIAPAAVSSQSRIDIKSTPAITSTVVAAPVAYSAPGLAYKAAAISTISYSAPFIASAVGPTFLKTGLVDPTILKIAALTTPVFTSKAIAGTSVHLDTPEVIAARFAAKIIGGEHLIKKRSAPLLTAPLLSTSVANTYAAAPLISSYHVAPISYSAPFALSTPLINKAYSIHPW